MTQLAFGQIAPGQTDFGNGTESIIFKDTVAVGISYTVGSGLQTAIGVSYSAQVYSVVSLWVSYWTVPPVTTFSINGDTSIPKPNHISYDTPQPIGKDISGVDVIQGFTTLTWMYDQLLDADISSLMSHYDPLNPEVTITYVNELGFWTQKTAMMQPLILGTRSTVVHNNVQLVFTAIQPD